MLGYPYVADFPKTQDYWPYHFCGTTTSPWQYEAADIMVRQWTQFIKTGRPYENWKPVDLESFDSFFITSNATNAIREMKSGLDRAMQFWMHKYVDIH